MKLLRYRLRQEGPDALSTRHPVQVVSNSFRPFPQRSIWIHSYDSHFHLCLLGVQSPHPGYTVCTSAVQEAHVTVTVTVNLDFHLCLWGIQSPHPGYTVCTSAVQEAHVTVTVTVTSVHQCGARGTCNCHCHCKASVIPLLMGGTVPPPRHCSVPQQSARGTNDSHSRGVSVAAPI